MGKININKTADIEAIRAVRQNDLYQVNKTKTSTAEVNSSVGGDKLEFSERASEVGKLVDTLKSFPDVRTDKVNELRVQISAGEYQPTSDEIANAILKDEGKN